MQRGKIQLVIRHLSEMKDVKAKLLECKEDSFSIEYEGDKSHIDELHKELEKHLIATIHVDKIKKSKGKNIIDFKITKESPADRILDVLKRYEEGATPRKEEIDD